MRTNFAVSAVLPQTLVVEVVGEDVQWFDGNRPPRYADADEALPDFVELWSHVARLGFFGGPLARGAACGAEVLSRARDGLRELWTVRVNGVEPGAFTVLWNLLVGRLLDTVTLRTANPPEGAPLLDLASLGYPTSPESDLPFMVVQAEKTGRLTEDRAVQVSTTMPMEDATADQIIDALDRWGTVVMWGGYAPEGMAPRRAGAAPDGAILYDEVSVSQGFSEVFFSDEATFDGVVLYALRLSQQGTPVSEVTIQ